MKKRQMILLPQVNAHSFVFFYEAGTSGRSWSIRDYSVPYKVSQYRASAFDWTADQVHSMALASLDAPTHPTSDLDFWHKHTVACNQKAETLINSLSKAPNQQFVSDDLPNGVQRSHISSGIQPILNLRLLESHHKWTKAGDRHRILHSPNSEDWVTWNVFQILLSRHPHDWFPILISAARRRNNLLNFSFPAFPLPDLKLWTLVSAPPAYECSRRAAMLASGNAVWNARGRDPKPVEGESEIEIAIEHPEYLVVIEAKLLHDISPDVTNDPARNQIVRNIDCLIEMAGRRTPMFWMLVRDLEPKRAYVQLMNAYRANPALLAAALPHRAPELLNNIAGNLTTLQWSNFAEYLFEESSDEHVTRVKNELKRRITTLRTL